jgi:hypothetical protein
VNEAVMVEAVGTPIGRRNGGMAAFHSADLPAAGEIDES